MERVGSLINLKVKTQPTEQRRSSSASDRIEVIQTAVTKTYLACNLPIPSDEGLLAKTLVMLEDLEGIPTEAMEKVFRVARSARKDSFFPSTGELLAAWKEVKADYERRKAEAETKRNLRALPEYYHPDMASDSMDYITNPTPEKLEKLREKYPHAGF